MPELPEVESVRRQLHPLLAGRRIDRVTVVPQARFADVGRAAGCLVRGVQRRGKYLIAPITHIAPIAHLDGPDGRLELVMHLGMTGSFRVRDERAGGWQPDAYVRASFHLGRRGHDGPAVLDFRDVRRFGRLTVVAAGDYGGIATLAGLGPEPLSDEFRPDDFARVLAHTRMPVKPFLLTQRPVAGVGNIYADEALWRARINPHARAVGRARALRLWQAIREVLAESVEREGTTFRDYQMLNGDSGRNFEFLAVYGRAGRPCLRCASPLRKVVLAGRGTTYCTACQRR